MLQVVGIRVGTYVRVGGTVRLIETTRMVLECIVPTYLPKYLIPIDRLNY